MREITSQKEKCNEIHPFYWNAADFHESKTRPFLPHDTEALQSSQTCVYVLNASCESWVRAVLQVITDCFPLLLAHRNGDYVPLRAWNRNKFDLIFSYLLQRVVLWIVFNVQSYTFPSHQHFCYRIRNSLSLIEKQCKEIHSTPERAVA